MTGRKMGMCGSAASGRGMGRGMRNGFGAGSGGGRGFGRSVGPGRGLGWFSAGYSSAGYSSAGYSGSGYSGEGYEGLPSAQEGIKEALEARATMLRAELARTEALLKDAAAGAPTVDATDSTRESGK